MMEGRWLKDYEEDSTVLGGHPSLSRLELKHTKYLAAQADALEQIAANSTSASLKLEGWLEKYEDWIRASDYTFSSQQTRIQNARTFVRWVKARMEEDDGS